MENYIEKKCALDCMQGLWGLEIVRASEDPHQPSIPGIYELEYWFLFAVISMVRPRIVAIDFDNTAKPITRNPPCPLYRYFQVVAPRGCPLRARCALVEAAKAHM